MIELPLLKTPASSDGFKVPLAGDIVSAKLDGPETLQAAGYAGGARVAEVQWELDAPGYHYLQAFWRKKTERGALPFLIDLISNESLPTRHLGTFVPGSLKLVKVDGLKYSVAAQVEISRNVDMAVEDVEDD